MAALIAGFLYSSVNRSSSALRLAISASLAPPARAFSRTWAWYLVPKSGANLK